MAGLAIGDAVVPFISQWRDAGVLTRTITGDGGDLTSVVALVADSRHVIVGGRLSSSGSDSANILSDGDVLDRLEFPVHSTIDFPIGVSTATGEALKIQKIQDGTTDFVGWIAYVTVKDGQYYTLP